jgi:hypothetical protein
MVAFGHLDDGIDDGFTSYEVARKQPSMTLQSDITVASPRFISSAGGSARTWEPPVEASSPFVLVMSKFTKSGFRQQLAIGRYTVAIEGIVVGDFQ